MRICKIVFKLLRPEECFAKALFSWRISVYGEPNLNKAVSIFKFMRRSVHAASGIEKGRVSVKATGHHYEFLLPNWIV